MIVRLTYARAYRDRNHTIAESAFKEPADECSTPETFARVTAMLREAPIQLGPAVCVAVTVGAVLHPGTVALLSRSALIGGRLSAGRFMGGCGHGRYHDRTGNCSGPADLRGQVP